MMLETARAAKMCCYDHVRTRRMNMKLYILTDTIVLHIMDRTQSQTQIRMHHLCSIVTRKTHKK